MSRTVIGLEITEEFVRAVEVRTGRVPTVLASGFVRLAPDVARDSEVLDEESVAIAVRQLWAQAGFKSRNVILGIGSRRILVREYTTQAMRPDLLRQALPFQVQDLLPVPVDQAVIDFYPATEANGQVSGLLVAAVAETVEGLISTLGKAKVNVDQVDLLPFGLARLSTALAEPGETVAMVHITDHTTYVVVTLDGVPRFVRIIPISVPTSTLRARDAAAEQEGDGIVDEFHEMLQPAMANGAPALTRAAMRVGNAPASAPEPEIADLITRVGSTLQFANARPDATSVRTVHISGSGLAIPGVHAAFAQSLGVRVMPVNINALVKSKHPIEGEFALDAVGTLSIVFGEGI